MRPSSNDTAAQNSAVSTFAQTRLLTGIPSFRATGRGYYNTTPDFQADASNANGILTNWGSGIDISRQMYLFIAGIETGWTVSGEYAQTHTSRNFYPKNLAQHDLLVYGQMANQFEYDKLVVFVQESQMLALTEEGDNSVDFKFLPWLDSANGSDIAPVPGVSSVEKQFYPPIHYQTYITDIEAGHKVGVNAPEFRLTMKVTEDYLQPKYEVSANMAALLSGLNQSFANTFGPFYTLPSSAFRPGFLPRGTVATG